MKSQGNGVKHLWMPAVSLLGGCFLIAWVLPAFALQETSAEKQGENTSLHGDETLGDDVDKAIATFGAGCFWCVEAVFQELNGVGSVKSGYMGGQTDNPTYEQICTGQTGHAEVIQLEYDPQVVSFEKLLEVFWATHDPTTLNRQGWDTGTQYRSAVFYHTDQQRQLAETWKTRLDESDVFSDPIVTEITAASTFFEAEDYHQNYFLNNPTNAYCQANIPDKLEKLKKLFAGDLKPTAKK